MSNARVYSLLLSVTTFCMSFAWSGEAALGKTVVKTTAVKKTSGKKSDISIRQDFKEPVVLASKDGVLEVRLTARQGQAKLDTVAKPANNFLLFSYEVIRGSASDGNNSATNLYPAPTLKVYPGEKMIVHFENELKNLTIKDYFIPSYTAEGQPIPLTPPQMKESPINLHIHGAHISPKGNADNVMLDIPPGMTNTYTYDIPKNMPQGLYWYHCHLHGLTSPQTYCGLAGMLAVGKTDGNIPLVTDNKIPVRNLALQYNFIFDRAGGSADLNNTMWPMWLNTLVAPKKGELESGKYRPSQMPVNFNESKKGTKFATIWYEGPLSVRNHRGQFSLIPTNLQTFTPNDKKAGGLPENPSLPDHLRDVQYTVNGQFQPVIKSKAGQTEIWVLANISDLAYMNVQLTETATGRHPKIAIVGQDGNPYSTVHYPRTVDGTRLLIPPATRFAIAVTIPSEGELILEMPALGKTAVNNGQYDLTKTLSSPGVMYTSNGTENPPGALGRMSIDPKYISYFDGFFIFPTQVLMRAKAVEPGGVTTAFVEGQKIGAYTSYVDLSKATPDVKRKIVMNGGFLNSLADKNDPKAFMYAFDGQTFPNTSLIQPRLNSIEEWNFVNYNNDEHPIHVHVNDFQVTEYHDPTNGARFGPENFSVDNANAPAPKIDLEENVNAPGILSFRTRFDEYTGTYVTHCHRLNHEDNGLMSTINVIPAVSTYAVAIPGAPGRATEIHVYDGEDDRLVASVIPFPFYEGNVNVAMGDVDGDGILDLLVGSGKDHEPEVIAYAGASILGKGIFGTELAHFKPFDSSARHGVTVASAQIDGTQSDNLIVGSPAGITDEVKVYDIPLAGSNSGPTLFASFKPYGDDKSGVSVAAGMVDFVTGREDIVTAPGAGTPTEIKTYAYSLFYPNEKARKGQTNPADTLQNNTSFFPFGKDYTGGVSLTTGWLAGSLGGAKSIIASQLSGSGTVKVFSSGSALDKGPAVYMGQCRCGKDAPFRETSSFNPFTESGAVHVAATSTTTGAHLVVSGTVDGKTKASVLKYDFKRPTPEANMLEPVRLGEVWSGRATSAAALGGF